MCQCSYFFDNKLDYQDKKTFEYNDDDSKKFKTILMIYFLTSMITV